ncbi:MAG: PVC-type heme-binding CxxCH protein [Planctomycetota bacterium]|nr:PVC-type heme-binding CxxCH protein [Planctomycetota bacterium]
MRLPVSFCIFFAGFLPGDGSLAEDQVIDGRRFTLPPGFKIEKVAGPRLVDRPINCAFDELGRLYVTESSGSNENVQEQLRKKPHQIIRLEDSDDDGVYDRRVLFADKMMFPEGAMWHDGSLYVCAPPQIWKLTDTNGDGRADRREVWFDGKTLTGCANDLHGPYLGPDGWIYWCKGAFAEQTYRRQEGPDLVTRAAHVFRRRPQGGEVEVVMTGGMDNPVEVVFTPEGERIFNTTFLHHPHDGKRDGLIHAIYGGVYGKEHGVLDGHPRTGDLMPELVNQDASAPSGLLRLESGGLGESYRDNLLCTSFNLHKVFRYRLSYRGSMLRTRNEDFVVCDDLDFHPTDVIEDADGSVLIVDTGGWYKLCCPTSQLQKPDLLGAIYRVRRTGTAKTADPRGLKIDWTRVNPVTLLSDERHAVRKRAHWLAIDQRREGELQELVTGSADERVRQRAVWALSGIDSRRARDTVRQALNDSRPRVAQAAAHVVSAWKDQQAIDELGRLLRTGPPMNQRVAAEALGRLGQPRAIPVLLRAAESLAVSEEVPGQVEDRALEHSLIYALIEIGNRSALTSGLEERSPMAQHVSLLALAGISEEALEDQKPLLVKSLNSVNGTLRRTAWRIVSQHPEWADQLISRFEKQLAEKKIALSEWVPFVDHPQVQGLVLMALRDPALPRGMKSRLLNCLVAADQPKSLTGDWTSLPTLLLETGDSELLASALSWIQKRRNAMEDEGVAMDALDENLKSIADQGNFPAQLRLAALIACRSGPLDRVKQLLVCSHLRASHPVAVRTLAIDVLSKTELTAELASLVAAEIRYAGPAEIEKLVSILQGLPSDVLGLKVLDSLRESRVLSAVPPENLAKLLATFGPRTARGGQLLVEKIRQENLARASRLEKILALVPGGDARKGQAIFHGNQASCIACHQMGYLGGRTGPSLSNIGRIRSERDLLESLMFPSLSFVRSFEPVVIETVDGRVLSGIIKNETSDTLEITVDAKKVERLQKSEIENRKVGTQSIMPSVLDKLFSDRELADLIRFLKDAR